MGGLRVTWYIREATLAGQLSGIIRCSPAVHIVVCSCETFERRGSFPEKISHRQTPNE